jgi:zinc transporter 5/7
LITPTNGSFEANGTYEAPAEAEAHHDHDHKHDHGGHDHSAKRSRFTGLLLPYTARWPLLHAIMTDKDSRRIFYFITYALCNN